MMILTRIMSRQELQQETITDIKILHILHKPHKYLMKAII